MKTTMKKPALLLVLLALCLMAGAQTVSSLQQQIKKAEEEIRLSTALLERTRSDKKVTEAELKLIRQRISSRKKIISSLDQQIVLIDRNVAFKGKELDSLYQVVGQLKKEYSTMVYEAYKNYKMNNVLLFLFASKDFNDATRRIDFMRRYNTSREQKAAQIDSLTGRIEGQILDLDTKRVELETVKDTRNNELASLGQDERTYESTASRLKSQEGKINKELAAKRAQIQAAQKQLQRIIDEEARKSKGKPKTAAEEKEILALTGRFDQNRGKLPYPVRNGVIVDRFGVHAHPTQRSLTVNNRGVNIAAEKGSAVKCVFDGVVTRVFFLQGLGNSVIVRHGSYLTIYSNMASVTVKIGDKVALNQTIGGLTSSPDEDECLLHFEIWKESEVENPENWLYR